MKKLLFLIPALIFIIWRVIVVKRSEFNSEFLFIDVGGPLIRWFTMPWRCKIGIHGSWWVSRPMNGIVDIFCDGCGQFLRKMPLDDLQKPIIQSVIQDPEVDDSE